MKIIVDKAIPYIDRRFPKEAEVISVAAPEINASLVSDANALIVRTRTACGESLLKGSEVKLVASATIGTDHIDIPWCEENGITVKNAPGCNAPGVAQYVFASLFTSGFNPQTDTLGIVGYGNVGGLIGEWAQQMGIKTLVCDPPRLEAGYTDTIYSSMEEVLEKSDAVTLHVPLDKNGKHPTFHLIGSRELEKMKKGAVLVNSSRGGVVDEKALKKYIKSGEIKAIIDVWENEPQIDARLLDLAFIATPHIAGYSAEGKKRGTRMALEALRDVLGVEVDLSGLECEIPGDNMISKMIILNSYDPMKDSARLKECGANFESLRNNYHYRHEPFFYDMK